MPDRQAQIRILARSARSRKAWLAYGGTIVPCALGTGGCRVRKREGDGATPIGRWHARQVFYRPDRGPRPRSRLPVRPLRRSDGWCDAVGDRNYNRWVRHPYHTSAEKLWRSDNLYDLIVTLDHNQRPRIQGRGSAVFVHMAGAGWQPTAGCIGVRRDHLLRLIAWLDRERALSVCAPVAKKRPEEPLRALGARTGRRRARGKRRGPMERGPRHPKRRD